MSRSWSAIRDDIETLLQDAGVDPSPAAANSIFATAEIDALIPNALIRLSLSIPWQVKVTKTTVADTRDITLSTGDKWRLIEIVKVEYPVDEDPREFRNVTQFGDTASLLLDTAPDAAESAYFFMNKIHLLSSTVGTTDLLGALSAGAAAGAVSLALNGLGTGTIEEGTTLMITGDTTVYYVTTQATIAGAAATVSIWPPLAAAALTGAVVTLSLTSTLDTRLEDFLERLVAARAAISKSTKSYAQVNSAIATIALAVTAISNIAAIIAKAEHDTTGDIHLGRDETVLGTTAVTAMAAMIAQAVTTTDVNDAHVARDLLVTAGTAITTGAETELAKIDEEVALAIAALVSGNSLLNTVPVGGGSSDYMGQAASDLGTAQGRMMNGQAYLQKAATIINEAIAYYRAGGLQLEASGAKAREAAADLANATSYYNAAGLELRTASEKANEAMANLRLVATRLQVSQGGVRYEEWGRTELAKVEAEIQAYGGFPSSQRYPRD